MKIRLTKEFGFEMSHALHGYDGLCKNIHGHSYKMFVTVKGTPINDINSPKNGMVMDFTDLKAIVKEDIIDAFDHALVLYKGSELLKSIKESDTKLVVLDYQPTCENFLIDFVNKINSRLSKDIELVSIRLHETATSYAEWFAEDN
ncbi:MAG: 6-pyruvoyltetrahydropterin synthase [Bacteroidetes bacterium]|nr:6-pyruvoyltetrahydropterin synthase [Bacteroidota bacterium]